MAHESCLTDPNPALIRLLLVWVACLWTIQDGPLLALIPRAIERISQIITFGLMSINVSQPQPLSSLPSTPPVCLFQLKIIEINKGNKIFSSSFDFSNKEDDSAVTLNGVSRAESEKMVNLVPPTAKSFQC